MEEKEVNLRDLVFEILFHWRGILLWILISGILFGTFNFVHLHLSAAKTQTSQSKEISLSELKNKMTQTELSAADQVLLNEYSCQKWQSYMEESVLMNLNPSHVYQADLIYAVSISENSVNPTSVYLDLLATNQMYQFVSNKTNGISISDAQELIHVINPGTITQKQETCSFRITAIAGTKKICKTISKTIQAYINRIHKQIVNTYGAHKITLLQNNISNTSSTSLLQEQIDMRSKITHLNTETADLMETFSEAQIQYHQLQTPTKEISLNAMEERTETAPAAIYASIKASVWGMFFAAMVYIFILFFRYIINNKLQYTDDCTILYQIPALGHIPSARNSKNFFNRIDHWLYSQRNKGRYSVSAAHAISLAATAIQITAHKKGIHSIYGISCGPVLDPTAKIRNEIQGILKTVDLDFDTADNVLYNADSMSLLSSIHTAVLIEKAGSVQYEELHRELEILRQQQINVLGIIIAE